MKKKERRISYSRKEGFLGALGGEASVPSLMVLLTGSGEWQCIGS